MVSSEDHERRSFLALPALSPNIRMIWPILLTFFCGAAYECCCVFWVAHAETNKAGNAVIWSMLAALVTCIGVEHFLKGPEFVAAYVFGYGFGTWAAIRVKARLR